MRYAELNKRFPAVPSWCKAGASAADAAAAATCTFPALCAQIIPREICGRTAAELGHKLAVQVGSLGSRFLEVVLLHKRGDDSKVPQAVARRARAANHPNSFLGEGIFLLHLFGSALEDGRSPGMARTESVFPQQSCRPPTAH